MRFVIALGGNALLQKGEKPTVATQEKNAVKAVKALVPLIKTNDVVITHGNGPQVGYLLMQQNAPLDLLDAETGGQIGYIIQQRINNAIKSREVVTLVTQVLVDKKDPGFKNPAKFIGPFYTEKDAKKLGKKFVIKKDSDRGYRRVVSSPKPIRVIEKNSVMSLLEKKTIVIAAGGGGIPVVEKNGKLDGIEAVIDKDLASACLANSIKADTLIMVTDIDGAYLNFRKKGEKRIAKASLKEIKKYYDEGHFSPGSMGPKIEAAIKFLEGNGKKVVITDIKNIKKKGTIITK